MNSLFTCSWLKNIDPHKPITEQQWLDFAATWMTKLVSENVTITEGRGPSADPRYARLMGLSSVRQLAGTMTPRYFATKVIKQLEQDHKGTPIDKITDEDLQSAMNLVANISRKLATRSDVKIDTQKTADAPAAKEKVKKGATGFETLQLNLPPDAKFTFEEETPLGYGLYTTLKDGLKYRVTLKDHNGAPLTLNQIQQGNVASVVVTEPAVKQTVAAPTLDSMDAPKVTREKPVMDFPGEEKGDFSGPDPEDTAYGKDEEEDDKKPEQKKKSSTAVDKDLKEAYRQKMRSFYLSEEYNRYGRLSR